MEAISAVIFRLGQEPAAPGLAPWLSLISIARTGCSATWSANFRSSNRPSDVRQP